MLLRRARRALLSPPHQRALSSSSPSRSSSLGLSSRPFRIGIVGGGPSGFYAATRLLSLPGSENTTVDLFEALPVPFGLARFGVAPDHPEVKNCEHKFEETARDSRFRFFGNVELDSPSPLSPRSTKTTVSSLQPHYDALLLTYGATLSRPLAIPGESLPYSLPARDLVAWYNGHPSLSPSPSSPSSSTPLLPGSIDLSKTSHVTLIGQGNVALDIARLLLSPLSSLSTTDLPESVLSSLASSAVKTKGSKEKGAKDKEWSFEFLRSPLEILPRSSSSSDGGDRVGSVRWGINNLEVTPGGDPADAVARSTEQTEEIETDLVLSSVGYRSVAIPGVPFDDRRGVVPNADGRVLDSVSSLPIPGLYASGWLARGPTGVIATTMYDAFATADLVAADLSALPPSLSSKEVPPIEALLGGQGKLNYTSPSSEEKSNAVVAAIEALGTGAKAWTFKADVGARDAGKVFLDGVNATFGPNAPVDIVVHNAAYSPDSAIADITVKEFDLTINVGLRGPLLITQGLLPRIPTGKDGLGGRIIMMSSVGARAGLATQTSYAATKSGLEGMMKVFATELRPSGITVNCVNPGPVKTE
ncbi:hypothetical protein RQP46_004308 [Phenoliferia psychrophenolica]